MGAQHSKYERAQSEISVARAALKDAGGATVQKLHFSLLDGQKTLERKGSASVAARETLEAARRASALALENDGKAEA